METLRDTSRYLDVPFIHSAFGFGLFEMVDILGHIIKLRFVRHGCHKRLGCSVGVGCWGGRLRACSCIAGRDKSDYHATIPTYIPSQCPSHP